MASEYTIGQLLAMDESELVQHIANNQNARGMFDATNITDWDEVSEAQQTQLLQRLM